MAIAGVGTEREAAQHPTGLDGEKEDGPGSVDAGADRTACFRGVTATAVAAGTRARIRTVRKWWRRFDVRELDGLFDESRPGQPRKLRRADRTGHAGSCCAVYTIPENALPDRRRRELLYHGQEQLAVAVIEVGRITPNLRKEAQFVVRKFLRVHLAA